MFDDYLLFTLLQGYEKDDNEEDYENEEIDNDNEEAECGKENDDEKNNGCTINDELKNFEHLINNTHYDPERVGGGVYKCIIGGGGFR